MEYSFALQDLNFGSDEDLAWTVEKGGLLGADEFLVDDLLDLRELEAEEEMAVMGKEEEMSIGEDGSSSSSSSSALSFEAPPPLSEEPSLTDHDVASLEWVSRMVDDSRSEIPTYENQFQAQTLALPPPPAVPVKSRRSKRSRTLSGSSWSSVSCYSSRAEGSPLVFLDSSASSSTTTTTSSASSCSSSSYSSTQLMGAHPLFDEIPLSTLAPPSKSLVLKKQRQKPKKRGRKPKAAGSEERRGSGNGANGGGERRCNHCGVNKTPQWRSGPMGAKTLCNACGVRYKSDRLFPEYRPACSPTFNTHVHSNSHRKVLEMRRKKQEEQPQQLVSSALPTIAYF